MLSNHAPSNLHSQRLAEKGLPLGTPVLFRQGYLSVCVTVTRAAKVSTWVWYPGHEFFQRHVASAVAHAAVQDFMTPPPNLDCHQLGLRRLLCPHRRRLQLPDLSRRPIAKVIQKLHFAHHVPEHCLHGGGLGDVHVLVYLQEIEAGALPHQAVPRGL